MRVITLVLVFSICVVLLISCGVMGIQAETEILRKSEFDRICHSYFEKVQKNDGVFSVSDQTTLRTKLEAKGYTITYMQPVLSVIYAEAFAFKIEATSLIEFTDRSGGVDKRTIHHKYENSTELPFILKVGKCLEKHRDYTPSFIHVDFLL